MSLNISYKGQFPKLKSATFNIPVESIDIICTLSHGADSDGFLCLLMVKLKSKWTFRGRVYLEAVSPESVYLGFLYLKKQHVLSKNGTIDMLCLPKKLTNLADPEINESPNL